MKRFLIMLCTALLTLTAGGCSKDDNETGDKVKGTSWAKLAKEYPFLSDFPSYDKTIDLHNYNKIFGTESLGFFDYECEQKEFTVYSGKLEAAGFTKNPNMPQGNSAMYSKDTTDFSLSVTVSYSAGSLVVTLSATPVNW